MAFLLAARCQHDGDDDMLLLDDHPHPSSDN